MLSNSTSAARGARYLLLLLCMWAVPAVCFVSQQLQSLTAISATTITPSPSIIRQSVTGADIEQDSASESPAVAEASAAPSRGKVNEIDFCIAPADVSLSRSYTSVNSDKGSSSSTSLLVAPDKDSQSPVLSLTRALNNASNRAVRRILLARAWPSAEALNKSFRQAAMAEKEREAALAAQEDSGSISSSGAKCPVHRPILNLLVRRKKGAADSKRQKFDEKVSKRGTPSPRSRTDAEYVTDQLNSFRERYGNLPGYGYAEAYLESVLSLATSGNESPRVKEVRMRYALFLCIFFLKKETYTKISRSCVF